MYIYNFVIYIWSVSISFAFFSSESSDSDCSNILKIFAIVEIWTQQSSTKQYILLFLFVRTPISLVKHVSLAAWQSLLKRKYFSKDNTHIYTHCERLKCVPNLNDIQSHAQFDLEMFQAHNTTQYMYFSHVLMSVQVFCF